MADATQELMLRVRGDNSGADKAIAGTRAAVDGLKVSGQKASGALKSFSRELTNAKSGADVAAAGAESLSRILEKSLAGVVDKCWVNYFSC